MRKSFLFLLFFALILMFSFCGKEENNKQGLKEKVIIRQYDRAFFIRSIGEQSIKEREKILLDYSLLEVMYTRCEPDTQKTRKNGVNDFIFRNVGNKFRPQSARLYIISDSDKSNAIIVL